MADEIAVVETPTRVSSASVVTSETFAETYADKLFPGAKAEAERTAAAEIAVAEAGPEKTTATKETAATKEPPDDDSEGHKQDALDKRFSKLTRQREDAKREAEAERTARLALEARIADLEKTGKAPEVVKIDEKPKVEQYKDAFDYAEALAKWSAEKALKERDAADAAKAAARAQEETVKAWKARQDAFAATTPDYSDVLAESGVNVSDQVRDAILESDVGPQLLYHLASNPEIADEISGKTVAAALRHIGRLEAKLEKAAEKKEEKQEESAAASTTEKPVARISSAPAPINPIKGISSIANLPVSDGVWKGTHKEYKAARAAGKIK